MKLLQGTNRPDRENKNEPKPDLSIPTPGNHLLAEALMEWGRMSRELHKLGLLTELDRPALEAYCQNYGRWIEIEREMQKPDFKYVILTAKGNAIQNPLVGMANTAQVLMHKFLTEFGMTPSSRTRISAPKTKDDTNPFANFG
ncbi:phage terminase small subunit P27 family [Maridesulfovibrio ferrireducens]|uniref:phage terminase small subunit P27 family n=1 Tax=Maridesulfovibrio ferrireducens TaxID=246191 RepID=UPI0026F19396|nr:phage terminase small subunit P27 family [Maridesulfovibrio ferrireducens]